MDFRKGKLCAERVNPAVESKATELQILFNYIDKNVFLRYKIVQIAVIPMDKKKIMLYDSVIKCGGTAVTFERGEEKWRFLFSEGYIPKKISFTLATSRFWNSPLRTFWLFLCRSTSALPAHPW
jgi:hypothetical protein